MRYQERIYIQNENGAVRNKDILNVNMSSDICIFESPLFNLSGASKIDCTGATTSYVLSSSATTIPVDFQFTTNIDTFTTTSATFKYEVYKYNSSTGMFVTPPVYQSDTIDYSAISATSSTTQNIPISNLQLDGDYLIKGYYVYDVCTEYLNKLGKKIDTIVFRSGTEYGLYDKNLDFHFTAIKAADKPSLLTNSSNTPAPNKLFQQVILPTEGQTNIVITNGISGMFIVTLNGLVLSNVYDYSFSGNVVTLNEECVSDDIISIIYTTLGGNNLVGDNILVNSEVVSGVTGGEGSNSTYFNTTTGKYELYTTVTPLTSSSIIVMINGVTLSNGVDFYQSTSNPKRIILEGNIVVDDMITIVYFPMTNTVNGLNTSQPTVSWQVGIAPQLVNGYFSLEVSTGNTFTSLYYTGNTQYIVDSTYYSDSFVATGTVGTTLYYRVRNTKNFVTLCGNIVTTTAYSETIPVTIQTNSINSY